MKSMKNTIKQEEKKQENNLDKDKAWIEHRKSDQQSREKQHYIYKNIDHTEIKKTKTQ
jgi:hypothetical protein